MKKSSALALMSFALAMSATTEDAFKIIERGNTGGNNPPKLPPRKHIPFHEESGILKMIEDYNLIQQGKSKKGKIKQARIISKIEFYLESGSLTLEHLKQ